MATDHQVPIEDLRRDTNPADLGFDTTNQVPPLEGILGQDRALQALNFGLQVTTDGYHIYAAGAVGSGKTTAVKTCLSKITPSRPTPPDWCYVHNFDEPDRPLAVSLPAGRGRAFVHDMEHFLVSAKEAIPRAFQGEDYAQEKAEAMRTFNERREQMSHRIEEEARRQGFAIEVTPMGIVTVPLQEGRPITQEQFGQLPEEQRQDLEQRGGKLKEELEQVMRRGRVLDQEAQVRIEELDREIARIAVGPLLAELEEKYGQLPDVVRHLEAIRRDIPEHLGDFRGQRSEDNENVMASLMREDHLVRYRVNLVVDNSGTSGAPVVVEYQPTYYNLFGRIDYRPRLGSMTTDFMMIKAGDIQRANGGYLVLQARDLLTSMFSWETLKRTLRSSEARVENLGEQYTPVPTSGLRPQPIPIDVKVVLVGPPMLYYMLNSLDEDFRRLFGVRADFDVDTERDEQNVTQFARFISSLASRESLRPFDASAVARIVDSAARAAGDQRRLTTHLLDVARLAREANFWATEQDHSAVSAADVDKAIAEREYRTNLLRDRMQRYVLDQTVHIATSGAVVAQVNGLSVIDLGDHTFGRPARITARTSLGTRGVVNIEREIELSGRIHSKGVLILSGYLAGKYAQDKPLSMSASLTFEQTYDEIEGDSASSAELYALLSALSGLPIRQGIAVTGSVNQRGEIQAIGGVNEKIEGFFGICQARGLDGEQGVIIPKDNVRSLMLRDEVVDAVREGKFRIWAVATVDEGIGILTSTAAGERRTDGTYPIGTVHQLVDHQIRLFGDRLKEFRPLGAEATANVQGLREREAGGRHKSNIRRLRHAAGRRHRDSS